MVTIWHLGEWASLAVVFAAGYVFVNLLHEPTHFAAAKLLGCRARMTLGSEFKAEFVVEEDRTTLIDRVVLLAPTLVGSVVALVWVLTRGWPAATPLSAIGIVCWAFYTLPSPEDILGTPIREKDWGPKASLGVTLGLFVLATVIRWTAPVVPADYFPMIDLTSQGLALAGAIQGCWAMIEADQEGVLDAA